ncbi:MAG: HNH endonuclease [Proteobacteria bacterium]|nr:HNH endonuclease [Pseudomonadota bacterium]
MTPRKKFSPAVYERILNRQNRRCACPCKEKFDGLSDIRWDHILSLHMGGKDEPENLQALKNRHHIFKSNKENSARAKTKRIQDSNGLRKKKPSQKDKVLAGVLGLEA